MRTSLFVAAVASAFSIGPVEASPSGVVISEFRARGPAGGNDEFVELFNAGATPVNVGGWQLLGCVAGTGALGARATIANGVSLAPGAHYLFTNSAASGYSGAVTGDATYSTGFTDFLANNLSGIRLHDAVGGVQDGVGAPGSPCREGAGLVTPASNPAAQTSFRRVADERQDGDDNATDFAAQSPADIDNLGAVTPPEPPVATFKRIHEIQGAQHRSPLEGQVVRTRGIVTQVFDLGASNKGFYLQDPDGDGIDATSEAVLVFTGSATPTVTRGQEVSVTGTVTEFRPGGASTLNLSTTELTTPTVVIESGTIFGQTAIAPTVIGLGGRVPPDRVTDDDTTGGDIEVAANTLFDPAQDGIDFFESLEGMRVLIRDGLVTGPTNSFGEVYVVADGGVGASGLNARGGITLETYGSNLVDYNPERIQIDDDFFRATSGDMPKVHVGASASDVEGIVTYNFGNFEVLPEVAPVFADGGIQRETASVATGDDRLTIANYNVENLDPSDGAARYAAIAGQIVGNLGTPDVLALQEVQDNSGAVDDGVTASDQTLALLVDAIRNTPTAGAGPQYTAVDVAPQDGTVGGEPGGNIRTAYLYRSDRVRLVSGTAGAGTSTTGTTATRDAGGKLALTLSPGLVDPENAAFVGSRKPLAAVFEFNGHRVVTVNNHWSSKGGSSPIPGRTQPFVNGSEDARLAQAQVVRSFVEQINATDPQARVLVLGDLNEFTFNPAVKVLTAPDANGVPLLQDLGDALVAEPAERYSYVFEGNAQALDHMLASPSLLDAQVAPEFDVVHVNAEFHDQISDHDPDIASFRLPAPVVAPSCVAAAGDNVIDRRSARFPQIVTGRSGQRNVIFGSRYADLLSGGGKNDCIDGGGGSDLIFGLGGNDVLLGGDGVDLISGGAGDDTLVGGAGSDLLEGGAGKDTCGNAAGDVRRQCE